MSWSGVVGAGLAGIPPGPELAAALAGLRLEAVPNDQVVEVLRAQARQLAHEQARMLATLVEVSRAVPGAAGPARAEQAHEWASGEVSAALCWTERAADRELGFAEAVVTALPSVFAALWAGHIHRARAWVFADHLDPATCTLTAGQVEAICARLVPAASGLTTGELAARLLRAIIAIDPAHARRRFTRALREREVISYLDRDGTVTISAQRLDPVEAAAAVERLRALAKAAKRAGHPAPLPHIQADLFCRLLNGRYQGYTHDQIIADLLSDASVADEDDERDAERPAEREDGSGSNRPPRKPSALATRTEPVSASSVESGTASGVEIRVGLATLLGLDDRPGEVPGLGPVLAPVARDLVAAHTLGARWRFAVVDTDGYLVLAGAIRRRPTGGRSGRTVGGIVEIHVPAIVLDRLAANPADAGRWAGVVAEIAGQYARRDRLLAELDRDPVGRFPRAALARHIEVRDRTCCFMGCRCPAGASDLDHTVDYARGGSTTSTNLEPGCRRHHRYKHELGWRLEQPRPGCFVWISPLGRTYHTRGQPIALDLPGPPPIARPASGDNARPPPTEPPEPDDAMGPH